MAKRRCSLRKLFKVIDADKSGDVTLTEVTKAFKKAAGKSKRLTYKKFAKSCRRSTKS